MVYFFIPFTFPLSQKKVTCLLLYLRSSNSAPPVLLSLSPTSLTKLRSLEENFFNLWPSHILNHYHLLLPTTNISVIDDLSISLSPFPLFVYNLPSLFTYSGSSFQQCLSLSYIFSFSPSTKSSYPHYRHAIISPIKKFFSLVFLLVASSPVLFYLL